MLSEKLPSKSQLFIALMIWFMIWWTFQTLMIYQISTNLSFALTDAGISVVLILIGISVLYFLQKYSGGYFNRPFTRITFLIVIIAGIVYLEKIILISFYEDIADTNFLGETLLVRIVVVFSQISFCSVVLWLTYYIQKQNERSRAREEADSTLRQAELIKIRQQLQPHFLFNSLNSINSLVISEPQQARKMILNLSDFLRGTLKEDENKTVPFAEELNLLELYLEIEKVRFGHRLIVTFDVDDNAKDLQLPPLLLQPVVENAIKFGLYNVLEKVAILIEAKSEKNYLKIAISNPYDVLSVQSKKGEGFGLSLIQKRLFLLYHRTDLVKIDKTDTTFTTTLIIPQL